MSMAWVRVNYKVPAKRGMKVKVDGEEGIITSAKRGYIMVRFAGRRCPMPCHPTWRVRYVKLST